MPRLTLSEVDSAIRPGRDRNGYPCCNQPPRSSGPCSKQSGRTNSSGYIAFFASVLGDRRWNDRWDDRSLESIEADRQHNLDVLAELQNIDRAQLGPDDQLNYDLYSGDYLSWIAEYEFRWQMQAANQMGGLPEWVRQPPGVQTAYQLADAIRFETIHDYEDWIVRLESFGGYVHQVITLLRRGIEEKWVNPGIIRQRVPPQVRKQIVDDPKQMVLQPVPRFPPASRLPNSGGCPRRPRRQSSGALCRQCVGSTTS